MAVYENKSRSLDCSGKLHVLYENTIFKFNVFYRYSCQSRAKGTPSQEGCPSRQSARLSLVENLLWRAKATRPESCDVRACEPERSYTGKEPRTYKLKEIWQGWNNTLSACNFEDYDPTNILCASCEKTLRFKGPDNKRSFSKSLQRFDASFSSVWPRPHSSADPTLTPNWNKDISSRKRRHEPIWRGWSACGIELRVSFRWRLAFHLRQGLDVSCLVHPGSVGFTGVNITQLFDNPYVGLWWMGRNIYIYVCV